MSDQKRKFPIWILIDILAAGALLCIFSLFHHVLPQKMADVPALPQAVATPAPTPSQEESDAALPQATPTPTPEPTVDPLAQYFSQEGIISTETEYKSDDVSVTLTHVTEPKLTYHVMDIRLRNPKDLRTAFAKDSFGKGITEHPKDMAIRLDAVCAVNGDYYGHSSSKGVVVRNGETYREFPYNDVLVMYEDGQMFTFTKEEYTNGLWKHYAESNGTAVWQAWCFGPSLLDSTGGALTGFTGYTAKAHPRTAVGFYEPGHYCFVTVDARNGDSQGLTMEEFSQLFEDLGCKLAYNMDGGKTSVMTMGDQVVNDPVEGGRRSSDIIYIADEAPEDAPADGQLHIAE